jgi:hypothetical protein
MIKAEAVKHLMRLFSQELSGRVVADHIVTNAIRVNPMRVCVQFLNCGGRGFIKRCLGEEELLQ